MPKDKKKKKEEIVVEAQEETTEDAVVAQEAVVEEAPEENIEEAEKEIEKTSMEDEISEEVEELPEGQTEESSEATDETESSDGDEADITERLKSKTIKQTGERGWYVIHSYAGYEDQVSENLKQRIETLHMQDKIFNVLVPKEKQIEIKNGKRRTVERRIFPGYVMVEMIVTDDSWYVVRNTPNVTGFIGMGVRPTPMLPEEVDRIMKRMGVQESKYKIELDVDDLVKIVDGPLKGFEGKVTEVDEDKGKVKVSVNMFGRETPVNLDSLQVKKI